MIELSQRKPNITMPNYSKMNTITLHMNKELIYNDYERLKQYSKDPKSKVDKLNIKALIAYLDKILKNIQDDLSFEMCWSSEDDIPTSYPISLINEKTYSIDIANYIEIPNDKKLIEIDLTDLADIIAFEIMSKDLGETHESIEELLKDCGIIGFEKAELLTNFFKSNGDKVYELSKHMKIEDSPYLSLETKKIHDYFNTKEFKSKEYKEVVEYSCKYAATIIANTIIKNCSRMNINCDVIILNATNITLLIDSTEIDIKKNILEEISIRAFGRRFLLENNVSIF